MRSKKLTRKEERYHVFVLIFQLGFYNNDDISTCQMLDTYIEEQIEFEFTKENKDFMSQGLIGIYKNLLEIDEELEKNLKGWTIRRLNKVDLALLRLAVYESNYTDIPKEVAINECINLAKEYSTDDGPGFINGVLSKVLN